MLVKCCLTIIVVVYFWAKPAFPSGRDNNTVTLTDPHERRFPTDSYSNSQRNEAPREADGELGSGRSPSRSPLRFGWVPQASGRVDAVCQVQSVPR